MATALSLTPLFRNSVGFDRFNDLFESLESSNNKNSFPPYDIVKTGENKYQILMAVAGYEQRDVDIVLNNGTLTVNGKLEPKNDDNDITYLHQGIAKRAFEQKFRLADHMKVQNASLKNGILNIELEREIPEEKKPQSITIN